MRGSNGWLNRLVKAIMIVHRYGVENCNLDQDCDKLANERYRQNIQSSCDQFYNVMRLRILFDHCARCIALSDNLK